MDEDRMRYGVAERGAQARRSRSSNSVVWGVIELDTELSEWLKRLPARHLATVAFYIDLLAGQGPRLRWPHSRQLDGKLRKLRFHLDGRAVRITYWIAPGQRIVLLTVFMKARFHESREIARARIALRRFQLGGRAAADEIVDGEGGPVLDGTAGRRPSESKA